MSPRTRGTRAAGFVGLLLGLVAGFIASAIPSSQKAEAQVVPSQSACYSCGPVYWDAGGPTVSTITVCAGLPAQSYPISTPYCAGESIICTLTPDGGASSWFEANLQESNDGKAWVDFPCSSADAGTPPGAPTNIAWSAWDVAASQLRIQPQAFTTDGGCAVLYCTACAKGS